MGKYYDDKIKLHTETKLACENIQAHSASVLVDDIKTIKDSVDNIYVAEWKDVAEKSFEDVKTEVITSLNNLRDAARLFLNGQSLYNNLEKQLDELKEADKRYSELLANEPKITYEYIYDDDGKLSGKKISADYYEKKSNWDTSKSDLEIKCETMLNNIAIYEKCLDDINSCEIGEYPIFPNVPSVLEFEDIITTTDTTFPDAEIGQEKLYGDLLFGGSQKYPYIEYSNGDTTYADIVRRYYPEMSEFSIKFNLKDMAQVGCGYTALANYIFESYKDKPQQYEEDFGFPMYYENYEGKCLPSVGYLLTDIYFYSNKNNVLLERNGVNNGDLEDGRLSAHGVVYEDEVRILNSDRYKNANLEMVTIEDFYGETSSFADYQDKIKEALDNGNAIEFDATNYTLYKIDENNNVSKSKEMVNAPHAMTITEVTEDGDYIVSSWGEKYVLDASSVDENFGLYEFKQIQTEEYTVNTNNSSLNIRSGPGTNNNTIGSLPANAKVDVYGYDESGNWARVKVQGKDCQIDGYVSKDYLAKM